MSALIECFGGPMDGHKTRVRSVKDFDGVEYIGIGRYRKTGQRIQTPIGKAWRFVYAGLAPTQGDI